MNTVLVIPTSSVENGKPKEWFAQRLDAAIDYYRQYIKENDISFVVTGRWNDSQAEYLENEARVASRYILAALPEAKIIREDFTYETGSSLAFSKPLIASQNPELVVVFCSKVHAPRVRFYIDKFFDPSWRVEIIEVSDSLSQNPRAIAKEPKALVMNQKLLADVAQGDDSAARDTYLYRTPFYYKGIINDKEFFDAYWPGGFEDFVDKRKSINNE